ncbi:MAG TPA: tetratricopeptide repeat protein [Thermoleophilaceae bacterium]|nr:tetratricopeptide repeat protein [Thermoleophilaceae bacterium]
MVVDNRPLALEIGLRIRQARLRARLTQAEVARGRYTGAYISALERGLAKPSVAAMSFIAERLGIAVRDLVPSDGMTGQRLEADLQLAAGDWQAALDGYEALLEKAVDHRSRADLLRGQAEALCRLGRGSMAIQPAAEAVQLYQAMGRKEDVGYASYWLAFAHYLTDNPAEARALLDDLLRQLRSGLGLTPDFKFRVLTALGIVESWDGQHERARAYLEEARSFAGELDVPRQATLLASLSVTYREAGDLEGSLTAGQRSLALFQAADAQHEQASMLNNLALTYLRLGNLSRAQELVEQGREATESFADASLLAHVTETEAQIALEGGELARASQLVERAIGLADASANRWALVSCLETRAKIAQAEGDPTAAAAALSRAADVLREDGPASRLRDVLRQWGDVLSATDDVAAANLLYSEALRIRT